MFKLLKTVNPPQTWQAELGAGKRVEVRAGPRGKLTLRLKGPLGLVQTPFHLLEDTLGRHQAGTGYTNAPLQLLPST